LPWEVHLPEAPCSFTIQQVFCGEVADAEDAYVHCIKYPSPFIPNEALANAKWSISGDVKNVATQAPIWGGLGPALANNITWNWDTDKADPLSGYVEANVCIDIPGYCQHCKTIWDTGCQGVACSCTVGYTTHSIDTGATPTTIAPGGNITITIQDGCSPYSWSVAGTGYTLDNATTTGLTNALNSAAGT
jgi:hypothetical protein